MDKNKLLKHGTGGLTMDEYIKRDAVHDLVRSLTKYAWASPVRNERRVTVDADDVQFGVDKIPSADVAPVRHGRWLDRPKNQGLKDEEIGTVGMVDGEPWSSCYCSECGEWLVASDEYAVKGNYCPNCGAKMDGGED